MLDAILDFGSEGDGALVKIDIHSRPGGKPVLASPSGTIVLRQCEALPVPGSQVDEKHFEVAGRAGNALDAPPARPAGSAHHALFHALPGGCAQPPVALVVLDAGFFVNLDQNSGFRRNSAIFPR